MAPPVISGPALATGALGVAAALAWNDVAHSLVRRRGDAGATLVVAVCTTLVVALIVAAANRLGRLRPPDERFAPQSAEWAPAGSRPDDPRPETLRRKEALCR